MQRKITGKKINYRPMIEAELSNEERERVFWRANRDTKHKRIIENQLRSASTDMFGFPGRTANWYCLRVETGREFAVEKTLSEARVEVFAPREKWVKVRRGEKIEGEYALFSPYLLVRCVPSAEAFFGLKQQKYVMDIVGGASGYYIVRDEVVEAFKVVAQECEVPRIATDKTISDGDRAIIDIGPFAGFECVVRSVKWSLKARASVLIKVDGRQFPIDSMPLAFLKKL